MTDSAYRVPAPKLPDPPAPAPPDPYAWAWASLRRRRTILWIVLIAFFPVGAAGLSHGSWGPWVLCALGALYIVSALRVSYFECPRCGEIFARKRALVHSPAEWFARRCVHCGLAMGSPPRRATPAR